MTEATPTLVDFNTICTVNIVGITEKKLDDLFLYAYPDQFTKILYENGNAIVTCPCHWKAIYFYMDYKDTVNIAWHIEDGQTIDPTTIPLYISDPIREGDESEHEEEQEEYEEYEEEEHEDRYDHPDLCPTCSQDYIDYRGRCENCRDINHTLYSSQHRPIQWLL